MAEGLCVFVAEKPLLKGERVLTGNSSALGL